MSRVEEIAKRDTEMFLADVERVRSLLQRKGADDLEKMLLTGFDDGLIISSLPAPLNERI